MVSAASLALVVSMRYLLDCLGLHIGGVGELHNGLFLIVGHVSYNI